MTSGDNTNIVRLVVKTSSERLKLEVEISVESKVSRL